MMKRLLSLALAVSLIIVLAVPAQAADDNGSAWVELLESSSLNNNGQTVFSFTTSGTMVFPLTSQMRIRKVDMLISIPSGEYPSTVSVTANSQTFSLTVYKIGSDLIRVTGYVPNTIYSNLNVKFEKSTSTRVYYQVLSCKISGIGMQEYQASADVYIGGVYYATGNKIDLTGFTPDIHSSERYESVVSVYDWQKFDEVTVWGSVDWASIDSIRASISTAGMDMQVNYFSYTDGGSWTLTNEVHSSAASASTGNSYSTPIYGKYLYCVTIDLSNADRTLSAPLYIYITGLYDSMYGAAFNCQYVNGSVFVADTSSVSWWQRFTSFMNNLFGKGQGQAAINDLGQSADSISQGASDIQGFEQSQQAVLDSGFATIQSAVTFTSFSAALAFVQRYANMTVSGISNYTIVFTLPLFLGLFFYLCSRVPGVTRWKTRPPKSNGGDSP